MTTKGKPIRSISGVPLPAPGAMADRPTVDSGSRERDDHLRSADLFDVANHPTAMFRSTSVSWAGETDTVWGDLTIHGVTKPDTLDARFRGHAKDPRGNDRAVFSATTRVNREDFGISWNMPLETGGLLVSREIDIEIEVETILETT